MKRFSQCLPAAVLALGVASSWGAVLHLSTPPQELPDIREIAPVPAGCHPEERWRGTFRPAVPVNAFNIASSVSGYVDDSCMMGTTPIGMGTCAPSSFSPISVSTTNADGRFDIVLYDETNADEGLAANEVRLHGTCITTYDLNEEDVLEPGDPGDGISEAVCDEDKAKTASDCPCRGGAGSAPVAEAPDTSSRGEPGPCAQDESGCAECGDYGSPKVSVDLTELDVRVEDVPVWAETAVGPKLELRLRFENSRTTNEPGAFGPGWRCNWESTVRETGGGTNVLAYPLGATVRFSPSGADTWTATEALTSVLRKSGNAYFYERDDGWTWEYEPGAATNEWRLAAVRDAWGNEVSVSYDNAGKLWKAEQTVPATGRMLEFVWTGGRVSSVRTEATARRTASFAYANGRLASATDMGGYQYDYAYTSGWLASVSHGSVTRAAIAYAPLPDAWTAANARLTVTDGGGVTREYAWEYGVVRKTTSRGSESAEEIFRIGTSASRGRVLAGAGAGGRFREWTFSDRGRVESKTDRTGAVSSWGHNGMNRVTASTNAVGGVRGYAYASNGVDLAETTAEDGTVEARYEWVPNRHVLASESNAAGRVTTYAYNALGLVTNRWDGRTLEEREYDAEGRLTARRRNGVLVETNRYDAFGLRSWTRDAAGLERSWTHDALGRVTSVTTVNGNLVSTESNHWECCWMDQRTDRRGGVWHYQYNDNGELEWEQNPAGLTTTYAYDLHGNRTIASNELEWTTHSYTPEGWLKRTELPDTVTGSTHAENRWYDGEGRMTKRQGISGAFWAWEYDAAGRVTGEFVPGGETLAFGVEEYVQSVSNRYDARGRVVWSRDIRGLAVSNEYDMAGRLVRQSWPDGTEQRWTYNLWDQETSFTDRAGNVTSNEYDNLGRRVRAIDAKGHATSWAYDDADRVTAVTNALGQVWRYAYDAEGHVISITTPDGATETRLYSAAGDLCAVIHDGICTEFTYDALGNRTSVLVGGEPVSQTAYDGLSRVIAATNAEGVCVTNAWDAWGQLAATARTGGAAETFQYGDRGLTNAVDRLGIATRTERDSLGRVLRTIDGNGNAVQVAYLTNGVDQVSSLWDGNGNQTRWNYDEWGLTTNKVYADGSQEAYRYDLLGRLTNKLDPAGNATAFSYDANGNLASLQRGNAAPFTFGYDALSHRTNMVDAVGTTAWRYDAMGRLVGESGPFGSPEVQVAYDPNGRLTNVTWGAFSVDYSFDDLGRIVSVASTEGTYAFTYLSNGIRRATVAYPNGVTEVRAHDALARCTFLAFLSGTNPLLSIAYAYDDGDRRTNEVWSTGRAMAYGYDDAHQLTSVSAARPSDAARYRYDAAGNPVDRAELGLDVTNSFNNLNQIVTGSWTGATLTVAGSVNYPAGSISVNGQPGTVYPDSSFDVAAVAAVPGTNTLTATYTGPAFTNVPMTATDTSTVVLGDTAYTHDANGNLTSDATFLYQYDLANQLTNVIRKADNSVVLQCRYDALGRRVEAIRSDGTVDRYVYFPGSFLVLAVLDETNAPKEYYTRGPDLSGTLDSAGGIGGILACTYASGPVLYHHSDLMGNVIVATDSSGVVVATFRYTPFGQIALLAGNILPRHLFSSKEFDAETTLIYYGYRYYVPRQGRWLTRDPMGETASVQLYMAMKNCGFRWVDKWGLWNDGTNGRPDATREELGHSDFPGHELFDYTKEDHGWTHPWLQPWRHFRSLDDSEKDLRDAVKECEGQQENFERFAHQMQDFFSHYGQGYSALRAGHVFQSMGAWIGRKAGHGPARPDSPVDFSEAYDAAATRTQWWVDQWMRCCCRNGTDWKKRPNRDETACDRTPPNPYGTKAPPPTPEPGIWEQRRKESQERAMAIPQYLPDGSVNLDAPVFW